MKTNADEPLIVNNGCWNDEMNRTIAGRGLTKREHFAAMAMIGLTFNNLNAEGERPSETCARLAVAYADSLIEKLNEVNNGI